MTILKTTLVITFFIIIYFQGLELLHSADCKAEFTKVALKKITQNIHTKKSYPSTFFVCSSPVFLSKQGNLYKARAAFKQQSLTIDLKHYD